MSDRRLVSRNAAIVAGAVLVDQMVKWIVVQTMALHEAIEILPFFALLHARNEGIAFSMLSGLDGWGLALLSAVVLVFVAIMWRQTERERTVSHWGFALIVGGAVGNLIDRVVLGYVVDYFYFHTPGWSFAVFNLADSFITIGAALVVLDEFVLARWRNRPAGAKVDEPRR